MNLIDLGWNRFFEDFYNTIEDKNLLPARIISEHRNSYIINGEPGELTAHVSGKFIHNACSGKDFPTVGDWVAAKPILGEKKAVIHKLFPRKSQFVRKETVSGGKKFTKFEGISMLDGGTTSEQVIASNIDTLFIVVGLDNNYNLHRIERYLTQAYNSNTNPVVILNKADLDEDIDSKIQEVRDITFGIPVYAISAKLKTGLDFLDTYLTRGKTTAFVGSSGVGKSSIINAILGMERQKVVEISSSVGKGKHTTTHRELIIFPQGGLLIDTPGLREIKLWCEQEEVDLSFEEIADLKNDCRFTNCRHQSEPGCAIKAALADGSLSQDRYKEYLKYLREIRYLEMKREQKDRMNSQSQMPYKWEKRKRYHH